MIHDHFREVDALAPPDDWDDVLGRAQDRTGHDAGDLPPWRRAPILILLATAAAIVLVAVGVAAFGIDGEDDTVIADRPSLDPEPTTTAPATDPVPPSMPSTVTTGPTTAPPATGPATSTTSPPPPTSATTSPPAPETSLGPAPTPPPHLVVGDPVVAPNGTCSLRIPPELAAFRPGISPVWSVASSLVFHDGSVYADDRSWPPYAIVHGEIRPAAGVTFEIGIGIGAHTSAWDPEFDLGANLVPGSTGLGTTGDSAAWPGTGSIHEAVLRRNVTPLTGNLLVPPPANHVTRIGVATSSRSHPDPLCNNVYVAVTAPAGAHTPAAIDGFIRQLFQAMRPG